MNYSLQPDNFNEERLDDAEGELHPHLIFAFDEIVAEINDKQGHPLILVSDMNRIKRENVNVGRFKDMILTDDPRLYSLIKLPLRVTKAFYEYFTKDIYMQEGKEDEGAKQEEDVHSQSVEGREDVDDPFIGLLPNVPIITDEIEIAANAYIAKRSKLEPTAWEFVPSQPSQIPLFPFLPPCPPLLPLQIPTFQMIQPVLPMNTMLQCDYNAVPNNNYTSAAPFQALRNAFMNQSEPYKAERPSNQSESPDKKTDAKTECNREPVRFEAFERQVRRSAALKIEISNLPSNVTEKTLLNLFGPYGDIKKVQITCVHNVANAFVIYKIKNAAYRAQRALDRLSVSGRRITVKIASNK